MIRFFYSPDVSVSAGGELVTEMKPKKQKKSTPGADDNFKVVAEHVCAAWKANTNITLAWTTQSEMQTLVNTFSDELAQRKSVGSDRPSITSILQLQNMDMDAAVTEVKVYIEKKYKKINATPQFARFGIVKENGGYVLPRDHNKRLQNLDLMIAAIDKDGLGNEEYGTQFWTDMKLNFGKTLAEASSTDGMVSGKVSGKNTARQQLQKVMMALRNVLRGNYPDTYPSVFREWGWQKQDY